MFTKTLHKKVMWLYHWLVPPQVTNATLLAQLSEGPLAYPYCHPRVLRRFLHTPPEAPLRSINHCLISLERPSILGTHRMSFTVWLDRSLVHACPGTLDLFDLAELLQHLGAISPDLFATYFDLFLHASSIQGQAIHLFTHHTKILLMHAALFKTAKKVIPSVFSAVYRGHVHGLNGLETYPTPQLFEIDLALRRFKSMMGLGIRLYMQEPMPARKAVVAAIHALPFPTLTPDGATPLAQLNGLAIPSEQAFSRLQTLFSAIPEDIWQSWLATHDASGLPWTAPFGREQLLSLLPSAIRHISIQ